jgi:hypothetical protein
MIRVGRRIYNRNGSYTDPSYDGFTNILVLTKSTEYGSLGPYELKDDKGRIMENIWQGEKVYKKVRSQRQTYSRYDSTIIWEYRATKFLDDDGNILDDYWIWRKKVMENKYHLRYPAGFSDMKNCLYAIHEYEDGTLSDKLDYIESRKITYLPLYCKLVKKKDQFIELKSRLENGENLLIIEVDGPHHESLKYYQEKYNVDDKFIENSTILINKEAIQIMLNDPKHPFGHGYCLAMALLDKDVEWNC